MILRGEPYYYGIILLIGHLLLYIYISASLRTLVRKLLLTLKDN